MKLTRLPLAQPKADGGTGRSVGQHLSGIIKYLLISMDPKRYGGASGGGTTEIDEETALRFELGFSWEEVALRTVFLNRLRGVQGLRFDLKDLEFQTEVFMDEIIGTPDAFHIPSKRILEAKLTFISAINPLSGPRFWHHRVQAMWYCAARNSTEAIFLYCFLGGDYRPKRIQTQAWLQAYSDEDLDRNRAMIRNARDEIIEKTKGRGLPAWAAPKIPPPDPEGEERLRKIFAKIARDRS